MRPRGEPAVAVKVAWQPAQRAVRVGELRALGEQGAAAEAERASPWAAAQEPPDAVEGLRQAGPRVAGGAQQVSAEQAVLRAEGVPRAAGPARAEAPPGGVQPAKVCRRNRRTCSLRETTCGTSGTLPAGQPARPGSVEPALRKPPPGVRVFRSGHTSAETPDSYSRRRRTACNGRFLVRLPQRSCWMLFSILFSVIGRRSDLFRPIRASPATF